MAKFGKFMKDQLMPEDPVDWIILLLLLGITCGGIILVLVMAANGLI